MSQGINNALSIDLLNTDAKTVEKLWKKFMKGYKSKTKKVKRKDEWFSDDAEIASVGGIDPVDVYAIFAESGDDIILTVWFNLGTEGYVSSNQHPEQYQGAQQLLNRFALDVSRQSANNALKLEENNLKKMESDMKRLKKSNKRYHNDIEQAEKKIEKAKANIETNELEQEELEAQIKAQKEKVQVAKKRRDNL